MDGVWRKADAAESVSFDKAMKWADDADVVGELVITFARVSGQSRVMGQILAGFHDGDEFCSEMISEPFKTDCRHGASWAELHRLFGEILTALAKGKVEVHCVTGGKASRGVVHEMEAALKASTGAGQGSGLC